MTHYIGSVPEATRTANWRLQGACSTHPQPDIWHATGNTRESRADLEEAKAVCGICPVQEACLNSALTNREAYGLWGGMTEGERRRILRIRVADDTAEPRKGGRPRAACGTPSAYDRHVKYGEPIDDACRTAHARASTEKRAKQAPKRRPVECGTRGGYQRHRKNGETACAACRQANTDADNRLRRTGTTRALAA